MSEESSSVNKLQGKEDEPEIEFLDLPYLETVETRDKTGLYPEIDAYWFLLFPEHINLQLSDIDMEKRILTIRQSKGNKTRRIKILKTHVSVWEQWFKTREAYSLNHNYVFFTDQGKAGKRSIERYFNKISEMIREKPFKEQSENERITSHTLRYTFAVKCWRSGMDLLVLSKILGHASLTTTQRYLRVTEEEILEKYEEQASKVL